MKTVLFDFDRTLLDTDALKREQARRIAHIAHISVEQVADAMRLYITTLNSHLDFNIDGYAAYLQYLWGIPPQEVMRIYVIDNDYIGTYLFDDVIPVLSQLQKTHKLGILTEAHYASQLIKLEKSGVLPYIDTTLLSIVERKTSHEVIQQLQPDVTIVDDDLSVIETLQKERPSITAIWMNRKGLPNEHNMKELTSLDQLIQYLG